MIAMEEQVQERFVMPPVRIGQTVLYYPVGERNGKPPFVGYIVERKTGTVKIKTVDGEFKGAVRHIDDPRLRDSPEQRKDLGAWDYTEEELADRNFKQQMTERMSAVEKQLAAAIAQLAKQKAKE